MSIDLNLKLLLEKKYRNIVIGSIIFGIFLIAILSVEAFISYKLEYEKIQNSTRNYAMNLEQSLNSSFQTSSRELDFFSENVNDEISQNKKITKKFIVDFKKQNPQYFTQLDALRFYDINGNVIANSEDITVTYNVADRDYFQQALKSNKGDLIISIPIISRQTKKWCIVFAKATFNSKGKVLGVVSAIIDLKGLSQKLSNLKLGNRDIVAIFTTDGYNIARSPLNEKILGRKINLPNSFRQPASLIDLKESVSPIDQQLRVIARTKLQNFNYEVYVGLNKEDAFISWRERTIIHLTIISLLLIGFSFFLINHLFSLELLEKERKMTMQTAKLTAVGEMAAGIAHEINNPLTIIQASVNSLRKHVDFNENFDVEYYNKRLDKINNTVNRISKITKGLRNFTRDSFSDPFESKRVFDLKNDAIELTLERLRTHGVRLIDDKIDGDIFIECREIQITQVIINLINNSFDAISGLDEKWIEIQGKQIENNYQFKVIDSGFGVDSKICQKIMDPFFTTKSLGQGTGLGLSISKSIIESHGGKFYLDTTSEHTTFIFEIPIKHSA